jgi:hypothetical protein
MGCLFPVGGCGGLAAGFVMEMCLSSYTSGTAGSRPSGGQSWVITFKAEYKKPLSRAWPALIAKAAKFH